MRLTELPTFRPKSDEVTVIVETPATTRSKYDYDEETGLFALAGLLPEGAVFPYDFGFLPGTLGQDGDPLDVLLLSDEPGVVGCLVSGRLIGVIEAEQTEEGETMRNDRLIAVASPSHRYEEIQSLTGLPKRVLDELEHFFVSYNQTKGKQFKPLGRADAPRALALVREGMALYQQKKGKQ